jgi:L-alanine-DL-glutamate epimerase-like enolase superfamily enzyme
VFRGVGKTLDCGLRSVLFSSLTVGITGDEEEMRRRQPNLLPGDLPPLVADESVQRVQDILALAGVADGVNVKLAKVGGLRGAHRMIALARELGMQVMFCTFFDISLKLCYILIAR